MDFKDIMELANFFEEEELESFRSPRIFNNLRWPLSGVMRDETFRESARVALDIISLTDSVELSSSFGKKIAKTLSLKDVHYDINSKTGIQYPYITSPSFDSDNVHTILRAIKNGLIDESNYKELTKIEKIVVTDSTDCRHEINFPVYDIKKFLEENSSDIKSGLSKLDDYSRTRELGTLLSKYASRDNNYSVSILVKDYCYAKRNRDDIDNMLILNNENCKSDSIGRFCAKYCDDFLKSNKKELEDKYGKYYPPRRYNNNLYVIDDSANGSLESKMLFLNQYMRAIENSEFKRTLSPRFSEALSDSYHFEGGIYGADFNTFDVRSLAYVLENFNSGRIDCSEVKELISTCDFHLGFLKSSLPSIKGKIALYDVNNVAFKISNSREEVNLSSEISHFNFQGISHMVDKYIDESFVPKLLIERGGKKYQESHEEGLQKAVDSGFFEIDFKGGLGRDISEDHPLNIYSKCINKAFNEQNAQDLKEALNASCKSDILNLRNAKEFMIEDDDCLENK